MEVIGMYPLAGFDTDGIKPLESEDNSIKQLRSF